MFLFLERNVLSFSEASSEVSIVSLEGEFLASGFACLEAFCSLWLSRLDFAWSFGDFRNCVRLRMENKSTNGMFLGPS